MKHLKLFILIFIPILSNAQLSGTYTIDSSIVSGARNFQSFVDFQDSINLLGVSDTVRINVVKGSGPYIQRLRINSYPGMSSKNPVIIKGNNETIKYHTSVNDLDVIRLNQSKHITIDSLNVICTSVYYGHGIQLMNGSDSNVIKNTSVEVIVQQANSTIGIYSYQSDFNLIESNLIVGVTLSGISIYRSNYCKVISNQIGIDTNTFALSGITVSGWNGSNIDYGNHIINNTINNFSGNGIAVWDESDLEISENNISSIGAFYYLPRQDHFGISLNGYLDSINVKNNIIHNLKKNDSSRIPFNIAGINIHSLEFHNTPPRQNNVINNVIMEINNPVSNIFGINSISPNYNIYHNTILLNDSTAISGFTKGFNFDNDVQPSNSPINFKNNIILNTRSGTGTNHGIYLDNNSLFVHSDYNNIYVNAVNNSHLGYNSGNRTTAQDWQSVSSNRFDQNSLFLDPSILFRNSFQPNNLRLMNMGDSLGVSHDILGKIRNPLNPTIGATESSTLLPLYELSKINTTGNLGISDSLNVECWTKGIFYKRYFSGTRNNNFYLLDSTSNGVQGIFVDGSSKSNFPSLVDRDSILIKGRVSQESGVTVFLLDSIFKIGSLSMDLKPIQTNNLDENSESKPIFLSNLIVLSGGLGNTQEMLVTNGINNYTVMIDLLSDVLDSLTFNPLYPGDTICSLTGIGSQYDTIVPLDSNYTIIPIDYNDFKFSSCSTAVGVSITEKSIEKSNLWLYPNPASGFVSITVTPELVGESLILLNQYGIVLNKSSITDTKLHLEVSSYSNGIYFIQVKDKVFKLLIIN